MDDVEAIKRTDPSAIPGLVGAAIVISQQDDHRNTVAIFGAGGFGLDIGIDLINYGDKVVFLDDDINVKPKVDAIGATLVGGSEKLEDPRFLRRHDLVIGIGDNHLRRRLATIACRNGARLATFIHPDASVGMRITLGEGVLVMRGAMISNRATIGKGSVILNGASVPHDCVIGNFVNICDGTTLGACWIGDDSFIGMGVTVNSRIRIGRNVMVGLGAAVVHDVEDNVVVAGVPARVINRRPPLETDPDSEAAFSPSAGSVVVPIGQGS
jgi:sugar O-acyltransferase (sialic acid O-acetyltransferase NeuD family)